MRYFPLHSDRFEHDFGIRAIPPDQPLLERTATFADEVALKVRLLREDLPNYFQALPESVSACREAADLLYPLALNDLVREHPVAASVELDVDHPLLNVARIIQEDLLVLSGDELTGFPIVAGVVCFPSGWSIADKIGKSIAATHAPVPEYESVLSDATNRLLSRLKVNRPVWRTNWGVRCSDQLDQSPKRSHDWQQQLSTLNSQNAGQRCFFRVERQTLSRLPSSGSILFTIHTHQCVLGSLNTSQRRNLLGVLRSCPEATLRYKGIAPMRAPLIDYLIDSLASEMNSPQ